LLDSRFGLLYSDEPVPAGCLQWERERTDPLQRGQTNGQATVSRWGYYCKASVRNM